MNYLAHALLSGENNELLIGNFIADHLRGNDFSAFTPGIVEGILLHRRIDTLTDAHPEFRRAKRFFYQNFEKYSGILVDIYFDHLLAKDFQSHHPNDLHQFSDRVYEVYSSNRHLMPPGSQRFLDYVVLNNVYTEYSRLEGIQRVLAHLSARIGHSGLRLDHSASTFSQNEEELSSAFNTLISDLKTGLSTEGK